MQKDLQSGPCRGSGAGFEPGAGPHDLEDVRTFGGDVIAKQCKLCLVVFPTPFVEKPAASLSALRPSTCA